jgi:hypothetical protein
MLIGILISAGNKKVIVAITVNGITLPSSGKDPMIKE